ncbi:MAG: hypothetical protein JRE70_01760 [Deltaproteobacteria bacterium]|nr:hypothetical protein [Deltaproteobacteria bacterium]
MSIGTRTATRLQLGAWGAVGLVCAIALLRAVYFADDVAFIQRAGGPEWIQAGVPLTSDLIAVDPANPPVHTFVKRFDAAGDEAGAYLYGHALRRARIDLNGRTLLASDGQTGWREGFRVELADGLRAGRNELRVAVANASGPSLLQLRLETDQGTLLETDTSWQVITPHANPAAARVARDISLHPGSQALPDPDQLLATWWPAVLAFFALGASIAFAWPRIASPRVKANAPAWTLAAVTLFWVVHYLWKVGQMPMMVGFDLPAHLVYIDYLREHHALPAADHGFSTYHPPLFHVLTTGVVVLFDVSREGAGAALAYRAIPFLAGLANVGLAWLVARRVWPGEALRPSLAVAFAGLLPMNIYMASYVSNESLHAALVSLAFYLAVALLLSSSVDSRQHALLSLTLGLALLTKFTSLLLAPVIAAVVALRAWWLDGRGVGRTIVRAGALLGGAGLVAGWFYLRNWIRFGDPLVWNLDVPGAATWWMQPGFHTPAWYTSFGEALRHPFFSGYASFWDGVYSTFWGDGLAGGMKSLSTRQPVWSYDFMTIGYRLAFPASLLIAAGWCGLLRESLRTRDIGRRLVLSLTTGLVFLLAFSLLYVTFSQPFYAQAKAFYVLAAIGPLSLVAAEGLAWIPRSAAGRRPWVRIPYFGYLAALGGTIVATFLG